MSDTDVIRRALYEAKALGFVEIEGVDENGEEIWHLTPEGTSHVEEMLPAKDSA